MSEDHALDLQDPEMIKEMLLGSGYSETAVQYYLERSNMGSLPDADQVTEMTGFCGDTMKLFLKFDQDRIQDAKIQVLGCPGAVASAMVVTEMIKGMTMQEAGQIKDRDVFRRLVDLPDQKQHCIRLTVKTLRQALEDYRQKNHSSPEEMS